MPRRLLAPVVLTFALAAVAPALATPVVVKQLGDASISHDSVAMTWSLAAGGTTLTLALDPSRDFAIQRLATSSNKLWTVGTVPDTAITLNGTRLDFGSRTAGFVYQNVVTFASGQSVRLDAVFNLPSAHLEVTRHYLVTSGSPTFETWTTVGPVGDSVGSLSDLNGFRLTVPNGSLHWLAGLQGDNADVEHTTAFTLQQKQLAMGEHVALGAQGRSSEQTVPWFAIDGTQDEFYAALMWSGAWSLTVDRSTAGLALSIGLAPMTTVMNDAPIDSPHAVFGVVKGGLAQATGALRSYVLQGIRLGHPLTPMVTYNTWFAYGTDIDEASMRKEMDSAASMGAELFVIDAGWYAGAGADGPFDFDSGLGSWTPDPTRFPDGLKPLTDYAHSLGLKFGIWVEPERVNLSLLGSMGVDESWLAKRAGSYENDRVAQICLSDKAARQWVLDQLTTLIDAAQPDYLKWDNNFWINCDRPGHGHGTTDGNFSHVNALYSVLADVRARYPNLQIENVSGGGNRMDLGMAQYSDVAWMDDRTAPSVNVRHNAEGLSAVFPPAYLLSFVAEHESEPLHDAPDMSLYFRSRMVGALGLCFRSDGLSEGDVAEMSHEIDIYKTTRATLAASAGALLTPQAADENGPAWDVLQATVAGSRQVLVYAFQSPDGEQSFVVKPTGLLPAMTYDVRSVDGGVLGSAKGSELMAGGISLVQSPNTAAHILFITAK
jgi:alpha-galactosidase